MSTAAVVASRARAREAERARANQSLSNSVSSSRTRKSVQAVHPEDPEGHTAEAKEDILEDDGIDASITIPRDFKTPTRALTSFKDSVHEATRRAMLGYDPKNMTRWEVRASLLPPPPPPSPVLPHALSTPPKCTFVLLHPPLPRDCVTLHRKSRPHGCSIRGTTSISGHGIFSQW